MTAEKIKRIIEYQDGKQRTPTEVIQFLKKEIDDGSLTHMVVLYRNDESSGFVPGSVDRNYETSRILWDVENWKVWFLSKK